MNSDDGNLYDRLGVESDATDADITSAYRRRTPSNHPDAKPRRAGRSVHRAHRRPRRAARQSARADPGQRRRHPAPGGHAARPHIPRPRQGSAAPQGGGDLLATVDVVMPTDLDPALRAAPEAFAAATESPPVSAISRLTWSERRSRRPRCSPTVPRAAMTFAGRDGLIVTRRRTQRAWLRKEGCHGDHQPG